MLSLFAAPRIGAWKGNLNHSTALSHVGSILMLAAIAANCSITDARAGMVCDTRPGSNPTVTNCTLDQGSETWTDQHAINGKLSVGTVAGVPADLSIVGTKVYTGTGFIGVGGGRETPYTGTVRVSGPGAEWHVDGDAPIPYAGVIGIGAEGTGYGNGTLIIEDGGKVFADRIRISNAVGGGGEAHISVSGQGSMLDADHLHGLSSSTAIIDPITIRDGGLISTKTVSLGGQGNSIQVSGAGSRWLNTGEMTNRNGFAIESGGKVATKTLVLDENTTITGASSVLHADERVDLEGAFNTGYITVSSGGLLETPILAISSQGGVKVEDGGMVTADTAGVGLLAYLSVDGQDSVFDVSGNFNANGRIALSNGGHLQVGGEFKLNKALIIGGATEDDEGWLVMGEPKAAGTLNADAAISVDSGGLYLNHTNTGYLLSNKLSGSGFIGSYAGETLITGDLSQFYASENDNTAVVVDGKDARLVLKSDMDTANLDTSGNRETKTLFEVKSGTLIVDGTVGRIYNVESSDGEQLARYSNSIEVWGTESNNEYADRDPTLFGRLGGSGTVGSVLLENNARIAPGNNSAGTLTVMGSLAFHNSSIYEVDILGNGTSDKIVVKDIGYESSLDMFDTGGKVTIGNNVNVEVTALDPGTSYQNGQTYTILTAEKGVSGEFAEAISKSAFLDVSLDHKATEVDLKIAVKDSGEPEEPGQPGNPGEPGKPAEPGTPGEPSEPAQPEQPGGPSAGLFDRVAETNNQSNTAQALNTLQQSGSSLALYNSLLMLSAGEARSAFESLSGEMHASAKTALISQSLFVRDAVNDRLRAAFGDAAGVNIPVLAYGPDGANFDLATTPKLAAWGQVFGSWSDTDGDGNAGGLSQSTGGFVTGLDTVVAESWRVGIMAGYSRSTFDVDDRSSSGNADNYHLGLYGGSHWGALSFRSGLAYTWHRIETSRSVAFSGLSDILKADYQAGSFQAFGEVGYTLHTRIAAFEPFANLAHVNFDTDGFTEEGGAAALTSAGGTTNTTFSMLGLRASSEFSFGTMQATANAMLGWRHAFGDTTPHSRFVFADSNAFTVAGIPIAEDTAVLQLGLDMKLSEAATLGISYNGEYGSGATTNGVDAKLGIRF